MSVVGTPTKSSLAVSRIATGSEPVRPPIDGLTDVPVWTNREATTLREIPGRVLMVGGSAVGVELGQFLARMGAKVTIVQRGDRLLDREDPRVGELTQQALAADGVDVRTGRQAVRARRDGQATLVELDDGATVATDTILGTTRRASYQGIPRVVFADPEIAAVGRTHTQAQQHGITVASAEVDLPRRSPAPGPTRPTPAAHSGCSPTATAASSSAPGLSHPRPANGSTPPPSPSAPPSRSTPSSTASPSSPPTARPTSTPSKHSPDRP